MPSFLLSHFTVIDKTLRHRMLNPIVLIPGSCCPWATVGNFPLSFHDCEQTPSILASLNIRIDVQLIAAVCRAIVHSCQIVNQCGSLCNVQQWFCRLKQTQHQHGPLPQNPATKLNPKCSSMLPCLHSCMLSCYCSHRMKNNQSLETIQEFAGREREQKKNPTR